VPQQRRAAALAKTDSGGKIERIGIVLECVSKNTRKSATFQGASRELEIGLESSEIAGHSLLMSARYIPDTAKVLEVILWLASARPSMDVYHVVKCAYYADKRHLNLHGRTIAGDQYLADEYGPLGRCVYGLLRSLPNERLALQTNQKLPFSVDDESHVVTPERDANKGRLSASDVEALTWAVENYAHLSFDELVELSHSEEAYRNANGGILRYEDMLDLTPDREKRAEDLAENARYAVF